MAANPMRGEAQLGDRKLVLTFNTACALEHETGRTILDLAGQMEYGFGLADLRQWIRVLVDKDMTLEEVGDWLGEVGIEPATEALGAVFSQFFPPPKKVKDPNPPKAG